MMKRQPTNREYVLGGLLALMAAFPLVTDVSMSTPLSANATQDSIERAFDDRADRVMQRRLRWSVLRDCAQREEMGEENACPDINDEKALEQYWLPAEAEPVIAEEAITASMDELNGYQRSIVRRARRNGQCPQGLDELLVGLQALCEHEVADGADRINAIRDVVDQWVGAPRAPKNRQEYLQLLKEDHED